MRHPNALVLHSRLLGMAGLASVLLAAAAVAAAPAIIPLPKSMTNYPGVFTLCPGQPIPGAPARATHEDPGGRPFPAKPASTWR